MRSRLCALISDIHFDTHHKAAWENFLAWCADWRPDEVHLDGDIFDFEMLSRFQKTPEHVSAIDEIKTGVREINRLCALVNKVRIIEGNHDERWGSIVAAHAMHLGGAIGLTLEEQCRFQGLDPKVAWTREDVVTMGAQLGPFRVRHGHKQSRGGFGPKYIAARRVEQAMGENVIVGHHHQAQLHCMAAFGKQAIGIANPSMTAPHNYAPGASWQTGFTVIECFGDDATAYPVVMTPDGRFAWGGRVYDGSQDRLRRSHHIGSALDVEHMARTGEVRTMPPETNHLGPPAVSVGGLDFDDVSDTTCEPHITATAAARIAGLDESTVRKQCRDKGITPAEWLQQRGLR